MNKLLWANWARLRQYKAFWLTLAGVFLCSLLSIWSGSRAAEQLAQSGSPPFWVGCTPFSSACF